MYYLSERVDTLDLALNLVLVYSTIDGNPVVAPSKKRKCVVQNDGVAVRRNKFHFALRSGCGNALYAS